MNFNRFGERILSNGNLITVVAEQLELDTACQKLLDRSSYIASLRGSPIPDGLPEYGSILIDAIQQPIMGYQKNGDEQIKVISGIFTYHRVLQYLSLLSSQTMEYRHNGTASAAERTLSIPVFILNKPPVREIRELLLLNELTRNLLKQCFLSSSSQLAEHLYAWFDCPVGQSLFQQEKWLELFPSIRIKEDLCKWLDISSKTFVPSNHRRDNHE